MSLTETEIEWLRTNRERRISEIAQYLGVCVDSAKRWMIRLKIVTPLDYPGAKYQTCLESDVVLWDRPCSNCKSRRPRPKWQYFCDPCKVKLGHDVGENPYEIPNETGGSIHTEASSTTAEVNNSRTFR